MRTIELTQAQREALMGEIENWRDGGDIRFEIEVGDDLTIMGDGWLTVDGYVEDDYHNGTGAYIETYREASITLRGVQSHDSGECEDVYLDADIERDCVEVLEEAA